MNRDHRKHERPVWVTEDPISDLGRVSCPTLSSQWLAYDAKASGEVVSRTANLLTRSIPELKLDPIVTDVPANELYLFVGPTPWKWSLGW